MTITVVLSPGLPGSPFMPSAPGAPGAPGGPGTAVGTTTVVGGVGVATGTDTTVGLSHADSVMAANSAVASKVYFIVSPLEVESEGRKTGVICKRTDTTHLSRQIRRISASHAQFSALAYTMTELFRCALPILALRRIIDPKLKTKQRRGFSRHFGLRDPPMLVFGDSNHPLYRASSRSISRMIFLSVKSFRLRSRPISTNASLSARKLRSLSNFRSVRCRTVRYCVEAQNQPA